MKLGSIRGGSLFRSTALTVAGALIMLQVIVFAVTVNYVVLPIAKRSADDLAALIVFSAQTWVELPPGTRKALELELVRKHNLWLLEGGAELPEYHHFDPYLTLFEQALEARVGSGITIRAMYWDQTWFWVRVPAGGRVLRVGFPRERLGAQPLLAMTLVLVISVVLTLLTALILARRTSRPLQRLAAAARHVGAGNTPERLPETGPQELAELAATFNRMAVQVQALLANRTTLLAGISHDLRTPLARMRLAIEMLPLAEDDKQVQRLRSDIEEMNRLIGEFITFSRGLEKEQRQSVDLMRLLQELADNAGYDGAIVWVQTGVSCVKQVGLLALRRILTNLVSNAVRYGGGQPLELVCNCMPGAVTLSVLDRGPGIPPEELENVFRPFYRLESSRSTTTGGSGLGLAIALQLAEVNGWRIELLPRDGGGTEARLIMPD